MNDKDLLNWIAARLIHRYGESEFADFIHKLRAIANATPQEKDTKW